MMDWMIKDTTATPPVVPPVSQWPLRYERKINFHPIDSSESTFAGIEITDKLICEELMDTDTNERRDDTWSGNGPPNWKVETAAERMAEDKTDRFKKSQTTKKILPAVWTEKWNWGKDKEAEWGSIFSLERKYKTTGNARKIHRFHAVCQQPEACPVAVMANRHSAPKREQEKCPLGCFALYKVVNQED
ncbi:hypothetical protein RP20_CCG017267 [Aedes albopictus]|nr:hypothetical protein RP20_CCG017267 [Aedes albopictus]